MKKVAICLRGVIGAPPYRHIFKSSRWQPDLMMIQALKEVSNIPVIYDPSHATGRPDLIPPCAYAGLAAGADGVHIEVHDCPEKALSDGPQALLPEQFDDTFKQLQKVAQVFGRTFS